MRQTELYLSTRVVALELGINHKRAQRVIAKFNLHPPRRHIKQYATVSTQAHPYQNFIKDLVIDQPHKSGAVICVPSNTKVIYGISLGLKMSLLAKLSRLKWANASQLVLTTLAQAFTTGVYPSIYHSDQGLNLWSNAVPTFSKPMPSRFQ